MIDNLSFSLETWNGKLSEIWALLTTNPPVVTEGLAPATAIWNYIGALVFNIPNLRIVSSKTRTG